MFNFFLKNFLSWKNFFRKDSFSFKFRTLLRNRECSCEMPLSLAKQWLTALKVSLFSGFIRERAPHIPSLPLNFSYNKVYPPLIAFLFARSFTLALYICVCIYTPYVQSKAILTRGCYNTALVCTYILSFFLCRSHLF